MQPPVPKFSDTVKMSATISLDGERQHPVVIHIDQGLGMFYGKLTDELSPPVSNDTESDDPEPEAIPA